MDEEQEAPVDALEAKDEPEDEDGLGDGGYTYRNQCDGTAGEVAAR